MSSIALFHIRPLCNLSLTVSLSLLQPLWISTLLRMCARRAGIFQCIANILVPEAGPAEQAPLKGSRMRTRSTRACCWHFSTTKHNGCVENLKTTSVSISRLDMRTTATKGYSYRLHGGLANYPWVTTDGVQER